MDIDSKTPRMVYEQDITRNSFHRAPLLISSLDTDGLEDTAKRIVSTAPYGKRTRHT